MEFAAGHGVAERQLTLLVAAQDDTVRYHFALRDRRAESPSRVQDHIAVAGAAQSAACDPRRYQRLHEHRHRGVRGTRVMGGHVAEDARRPERCPA